MGRTIEAAPRIPDAHLSRPRTRPDGGTASAECPARIRRARNHCGAGRVSEIRVFHGLYEVPPDFGPCAITIGNFDGLHVGHRHLMQRVVQVGTDHGWTPSALTFDPHPARIVAPDRAPKLLSTPEQRVQSMAEEGILQVLILPFTSELSPPSPEDFVSRILHNRLQAKAVLVGDNFRFGYRHA